VQTIEFYQSLWAMELRRPGQAEPSMEESFAKVAEAGFAGIGLDLAVADMPIAEAARPLFRTYGLKCLCNGFPRSDDELRFMLAFAKDLGAPHLSVIGQIMPRDVDGMINVVRRWIDISDDAGLPLLFETHRHGLLNDLYPTLTVLEAVPDLDLCADLSHFVVDREFALPITPEADAMIGQVLDRSWALQGRIASNEQVQVQIGFAQHRGWVDQFLRWWDLGMRSWRARASADAVLTFLCELGPPPYAITGPDGLELTDRWGEALEIRDRVAGLWRAGQAG